MPVYGDRVRVVGVDNFKCEPGENEVVYVEMGIYHGGHLLGSICHTAELTPSAHMRWNQWLVFDVQLKNLPKVAFPPIACCFRKHALLAIDLNNS